MGNKSSAGAAPEKGSVAYQSVPDVEMNSNEYKSSNAMVPWIFDKLTDKGFCDRCHKNQRLTKVCKHMLCRQCIDDCNVRDLKQCPVCMIDMPKITYEETAIGYKVACFIDKAGDYYPGVGCLLTLQIPIGKNNDIYFSGTGDKVDFVKFPYADYTKYAATRVYVLGVQFFGEPTQVLKALTSYAKNNGIIVSGYDKRFEYRTGYEISEYKTGQIVREDSKIEDRIVNVRPTSCCSGIHFFKTKQDVMKYVCETGFVKHNILTDPTMYHKRLSEKRVHEDDTGIDIISTKKIVGVSNREETKDFEYDYYSKEMYEVHVCKATDTEMVKHIMVTQNPRPGAAINIYSLCEIPLIERAFMCCLRNESFVFGNKYKTVPGYVGLFDVDQKMEEVIPNIVKDRVKLFYIPTSWDMDDFKHLCYSFLYSYDISAECIEFAKSIGMNIEKDYLSTQKMQQAVLMFQKSKSNLTYKTSRLVAA